MTIISLCNLMSRLDRMLLKKLSEEEWLKEGPPGIWGIVSFCEVTLAFAGMGFSDGVSE